MMTIAYLGVKTVFAPWQWLGFGTCLVFFATAMWFGIKSETCVSIVPCFQKPLVWPEALYNGKATAKNCLRLDEIATQQGVRTLSSYGFAVTARPNPVEWSWPGEGLRSIQEILSALKEGRSDVELADQVISDLEALYLALELAETQEIRFCLSLRLG